MKINVDGWINLFSSNDIIEFSINKNWHLTIHKTIHNIVLEGFLLYSFLHLNSDITKYYCERSIGVLPIGIIQPEISPHLSI